MRAAIYTRISQDRGGAGLGVARQQQDCTALCEAHGWTVIDTIVDNDVSAYSGKARPGYGRLLELVRSGSIDTIVAWHPDRLHRHPRELEDFVALLDQHRVVVTTVTAGDVDLSTAEGRFMARIVGAVARKESEDKSRRLRRKHVELAEQGRIGGGGRRPFGYEADRVTIRPSEAVEIADAVTRVLAGESVRSIARDWQARGVPTVAGAPWSSTTVKRLLGSARISGRRSHLGAITSDAVWPGIISPEESDAVRAVLDQRSRTAEPRREPRSYLLAGLVLCGECGGTMSPRPVGGLPRYGCHPERRTKTSTQPLDCGKVSADAAHLEETVVGRLLAVVAASDAAPLPERRAHPKILLARLAADEEALAGLSHAYWVERTITEVEYRAARAPLEQAIAAARAAVVQPQSAVSTAGGASAVVEQWDDLSFGRRRSIVVELVESATVAAVGKGGRWRPERVAVTWRR